MPLGRLLILAAPGKQPSRPPLLVHEVTRFSTLDLFSIAFSDLGVEMAAANLGRHLRDAATQGTIERVGALLDQGVFVNSRGGNGWTALIRAAARGHREIAALLLDRGANVNAKTSSRDTPAIWASSGGHLDTLQLLVSRGADIHHRSQAETSSLLYAALWDHLPVCEYLLSLGADLMAASDTNQTAYSDYGRWAKLAHYGGYANYILSPETKALRIATLEACWAAGPHPSQVQRRRDERWARRGPLITVLAEHAYRPLQLRAQAIALAAAELDPSEAVVVQTSRMQDVLRDEGLVRYVVSFL